MKCNEESLFFTLATNSFQIAPSNMEPEPMALSTSAAPWSNTRPHPIALCPTSELPMSESSGSPTAVPCALTSV